MKNFELHIPTKIVFGKGVISSLGDEAVSFGKKALLVYGKGSIKRNGTYNMVISSLNKSNIEYIEHPGVHANPTLKHAEEGVRLAKENNVDMVIAVGGGSVMDESKAIAAGVKNERDLWDYFLRRDTIKDALPVITVVTMPATSSEMNPYMVLTNEEKLKVGLKSVHTIPKVSFLDPTVTMSIPVQNTAYACTDILSHMFEVYFNSKEKFNPVNDGYIEGLCKAVMRSMEVILENPKDYDARASIMWGATLAWNGISSAGVEGASTPCHKLEHPLSGLYDIAHGAGLSIVTPVWLRYVKSEKGDRIVKFAENIMGITEGTKEEKIDKSIDELVKWYKKIGTPTTFTEAGIDNPDIDTLADQVVIGQELFKMVAFNRDQIVEILNQCR